MEIILIIAGAFSLIYLIIVGIKKIIDNFYSKKVTKISENIKDLKDLNREFTFKKQIDNERYIKHRTKSLVALDNLIAEPIICYHIENNIDKLYDDIMISKSNKMRYELYLLRLKNLNKEPNSEALKKEGLSLKKFKHYVKKVMKDLTIPNPYKIILHFEAYYTSPAGRNHYNRTGEFDFDDLMECYNSMIRREKYKISAEYERSVMTDGLRYDVLKRDKFRCQVCGATASDGVKLHVDHIIPVSKGGKTTLDNLQTLCERCNMGKSNKL